MPTFPNYRGELPACLNPFKLRHYFLIAYWVYFRPTALHCYLYQADPNLYQLAGGEKLRRIWRQRAYRHLFIMLPATIVLLLVLVGLIVFLFTTATVFGHDAPINAVVASKQQVVSASADGVVKVWDYSREVALHTFKGHIGTVNALAIAPDGRVAISGSGDRNLKVWDLRRGKGVKTLKGHSRWITAVEILPEERAISASGDGLLKVWNLKSGKEIYTLLGHTAPVTDVAVTRNGKLGISASSDRTLKVWDLTRGTQLHTLSGHTAPVTDVAVISPERAISASGDRTLKVWDLLQGKEIYTLSGHKGWITAVAVTPDGRRAISASSEGNLKVWDLVSGKELHTLTGHTGWVNVVLSNPNGNEAISASSDRTIKVWDLQEGTELHTLKGDTSWVKAMAVLPGEMLVSAAADGFLEVWNLSTGAQVRPAGAKAMQFLSALALWTAFGLMLLAVVLAISIVLAIAFMAFGATGSIISGISIGLAIVLLSIGIDLLVQHLALDPSFKQVYAGINISGWLLLVAGIAFGLIISAVSGLNNRKALGVISSILFILAIGIIVGLASASIVNKSAISVRGRLLPGVNVAVQIGIIFNFLVFLGTSRILFYPLQFVLALNSAFRGKRHPVEWDELIVLPLPGTCYYLQKLLQGDEGRGLLAIADVAVNPFQRAWTQPALQKYLHKHPYPLHFLYGLFASPDLNAYVSAPSNPQDWKRLPTTAQVLVGALGNRWVDRSSDGANRGAERLLWNLTEWRSRRQTLLTDMARLLYLLSDKDIVNAADFDLSQYSKTYANLTQYPGGTEIADSFAALAFFLTCDRFTNDEIGFTSDSANAIRPSVLRALDGLREIATLVAANQAVNDGVERLATFAGAISSLNALDDYVVAEVLYPEHNILRRIITQWQRAIGLVISHASAKLSNH